MRAFTSSLAFAALLLVSCAAKADTLFQFQASGTGFSTSGTLQGTHNGDGSYTITGITGNGITQLIAPGTSSYFNNDNLLFVSNPRQLDVNGIDFNLVANGTTYEINLFSNLGYNPPTNFLYYADMVDGNGNYSEVQATFSATAATPEPSTLFLLGTGVLGVASQLRRRLSAA